MKQQNGIWKLHLPYFHPDTKFDNIISNKIDIAITYDGVDWMHRLVNLSTKHEPGYDVQITGNNVTNDKGFGTISIIVESIKGISNKSARVDISGQKTVYLKGAKEVISIPVNNIPEGESKTFTYTVTITEDGCPIIKKPVSKVVTYPKQEKEEKGEKSVEISGTALFNSTKYREKISKDKTVFLNILYDRVNNTALSYDYENDKKVSLNIVNSKTERNVAIKNGKPVFKIKVKMQADISEISGGVSSRVQSSDIEKIKTAGENYIEKETKKLLNSLYNEYNSDSVGFARLIYICQQEFFKKNEKNLDFVLQNSIYEVEVDLKIRRMGHEFIT